MCERVGKAAGRAACKFLASAPQPGLGGRGWGLTLALYCPKHSAAEPSSLLAFGLWYNHCIFLPVSCITEKKALRM